MSKGMVLVVDDDPTIRTSIAALLRREGYETAEVGTAEAARAWLELPGSRADVAVIDWRLPATGGQELATWLLDRSPGTSVLVVSGLGPEAIGVHGYPGSRVQVLGKPFHSEELMGMVSLLLRGRGEVDAGVAGRHA